MTRSVQLGVPRCDHARHVQLLWHRDARRVDCGWRHVRRRQGCHSCQRAGEIAVLRVSGRAPRLKLGSLSRGRAMSDSARSCHSSHADGTALRAVRVRARLRCRGYAVAGAIVRGFGRTHRRDCRHRMGGRRRAPEPERQVDHLLVDLWRFFQRTESRRASRTRCWRRRRRIRRDVYASIGRVWLVACVRSGCHHCRLDHLRRPSRRLVQYRPMYIRAPFIWLTMRPSTSRPSPLAPRPSPLARSRADVHARPAASRCCPYYLLPTTYYLLLTTDY